jgi:hypothetical protein
VGVVFRLVFMRLILFLTVTVLVISGCATKPESIAPAYISDMAYKDWTCSQLAQEQSRLTSALSAASDAQRRARTNDTWGVILIGLPTASLSGSNVASEIARLKGELQALQRAAILKNCNLPNVPDPSLKKKRRAQS